MLALVCGHNKVTKDFAIGLTFVLLAILAGFRGDGVDLDNANYKKAFELMYNDNGLASSLQDFATYSTIGEPSFYYIGIFFRHFFNDSKTFFTFLFFLYAIAGTALNLSVFRKLSKVPLLCILVYYSYYFMLHEMTQIRAGVALGICYLAIPYIKAKKFLLFATHVAGATLFHFSAIMFMVVYWLDASSINRRHWFMAVIISIVIGFLGSTMESSLTQTLNLLVFYIDKLTLYIDNDKIPFFSTKFLFSIFTVFLFLTYADKIALKNPYSIIVIKIYSLSVITYALFFVLPPVAYRISDIFGSVFPIVCSYIYAIVPSKLISYLFVIAVSLMFLGQILFGIGIIRPYTITSAIGF